MAANRMEPLSQHQRHWSIDLRDVPALLRLLEDHALTVDIGLISHAGEVAIRAAGISCCQEGPCLRLAGPDASLCIDLERLSTARAVRDVNGCWDRVSLELLAEQGEYRISVPRCFDSAGIWGRVMEALASSHQEPLQHLADGFDTQGCVDSPAPSQ
ncbi:hypothetical protein Tgr7_2725 [Thioalkalivibrio sulfidiphilus HL-EbGr7]|uniref:Uncharacterized protein n=1 Tax=Thioalkalivibrio sulfidiphilus (strain HL-EbGR7) TaxID=396588 RepID=B8GMY5_THISH|nr:hypothetical protein Tgr7_2725 [Thioalkalivibrio sulfidiphilus HL-EbGr7]